MCEFVYTVGYTYNLPKKEWWVSLSVVMILGLERESFLVRLVRERIPEGPWNPAHTGNNRVKCWRGRASSSGWSGCASLRVNWTLHTGNNRVKCWRMGQLPRQVGHGAHSWGSVEPCTQVTIGLNVGEGDSFLFRLVRLRIPEGPLNPAHR